MMSEEAQQRLYMLLDKQNLAASSPSNSMPIKVTKEMLEHIDNEQLSYHLYFLLSNYMQITSLFIERATKPFNGPADLLPIHFIRTSKQLDLVEECLRKICTLSKSAIPFLNLDLVTQITLEADSVIHDKEKFCQFLEEEKEKYRSKYVYRTKRSIKSKFTDFRKRWEEFQQKLPGN